MVTVRLENVSKVYTAPQSEGLPKLRRRPHPREGTTYPVRALDHVTLTIPDGQTLAVVGPSGCGKSTLLRVIAGLTDYTGRVLYDGRDVRDLKPQDRRIGLVFQNYALYPHFLGHGNLKFTFLVRHVPDAEAEERIRITSEMMGIGFEELLKRKAGTLSGGEQQRVAVARALVRNPDILLLDEPLSNLDAKLRVQTRGEIKRLLQRFRITTVYVTHDQTEAIALGDRIAVMREGRIVQVGPYEELYHDPADAFVAGFLGIPPMNLLEGHVEGGYLHIGTARMPLPKALAHQTRDGQRLLLGIHPEDVRFAKGAVCRHGIRLQGQVEIIEPDFAHRRQIIYVRIGTHTYSVQVPQEIPLHIGHKVEFDLPLASLYFFDASSGRRIT